MALLSDLGDLQYHITAVQSRSHRKCAEIDPLNDQIFPERAMADPCASFLKCPDLIIG